MKKRLGVVLAAGLLLLSACGTGASGGGSSSSAKDSKEIVVGGNLELSGSTSAYGKAEKEGIELAVEEINKDGGILDKKVKFVTKDNKSDNAESASVTANLITNDKAVVIIGPATSNAVKAAIPNATKSKVPLITPSGTDDAITVDNGKVQPYAFRACFQDSAQGIILAKYAMDNLDAKKVVIIGDNSSDYAKGLTKSFKETFKGTIVEEEYFTAGDKDFQSILTKIKGKEFDFIYLPGYYTEAGLIIKQARELGIEQPVLGADGFGNEKLVETAGASNITNVYYTGHFSAKAPANDKVPNFIQAFKDKYNKEPSSFNALGYDSMYMLKAAIESAGEVDSQKITDALASLKDFEGVTGTMTIDKEHNPEKPLVVLGMTDGKESSAETINPD